MMLLILAIFCLILVIIAAWTDTAILATLLSLILLKLAGLSVTYLVVAAVVGLIIIILGLFASRTGRLP